MYSKLGMVFVTIVTFVCGCGHSGEIQEFGRDLKTVARSMASEVDADPSRAGVSAAMKEFSKERKALRSRWDKLRRKTLSPDEKGELLRAVGDSRLELTQLTAKHLAEMHRNAAFGSSLALLQREFEEYFDMENIR